MHIFGNKNLAIVKIIFSILISTFIANINVLRRYVIQFFALIFRYMYLNLIFKNLKMAKIRLFVFEIFEYNNSILIDKASILQINIFFNFSL